MMNFIEAEWFSWIEIEKRVGDVLYFQDIASFFISNSCLQISTAMQTAYIQVGNNMHNALSEYFQLAI